MSPERTSRSHHAADRGDDAARLDEVIRIVDSALATFEPPPGWSVLRSSGRLEARWWGDDGRWARFSVRLATRGSPLRPGTVFFRRPIGDGHLSVVFDSCDLGEDIVQAACELLTPLQRMLAQAGTR